MKLTNTKVYDTVKEVIGEDSLKIIEYLKDKKNISDFKIAEKVDKDIHEVRNPVIVPPAGPQRKNTKDQEGWHCEKLYPQRQDDIRDPRNADEEPCDNEDPRDCPDQIKERPIQPASNRHPGGR